MSETIFTNEMEVLFKFYGKRDDEILVEIQPKIINDIHVEIEIPPQNMLTSIYDLIEAPLVSLINHPIEDTFVTSDTPYNAMNYGGNKSMLVGRDIRGLHQSLVKFNLDHVPANINIKSARLRMYYSYLEEFKDLALYLARDDWSEYNVTYLNRPRVKRFVSNQYTVNANESYVEFDVSNEVFEWVKGIDNYGFILSSESMTTTFRTRESSYSPTLLIDYKEIPKHQSTYNKKNVELIVRAIDYDDINVDLEVHSDFSFESIPVEIHVHRADEFMHDDIDVELIVTREEVLVEIQPIFNNSDEIDVEISVGVSTIDDIPIEIVIPQYNDVDEIDVEITVQREDIDSIDVDIEIANPIHIEDEIDIEIIVQNSNTASVDVELEVPLYNDEDEILVDIEVLNESYNDSSINVEIEIPSNNGNDDINVEINIYEYNQSDIDVEITPVISSHDVIDVDLEVNSANNYNDIPVDIEVPLYSDEDEILVEVYPRVNLVDDINVEINIYEYNQSDIDVEITPVISSHDVIDVDLEVNSANNYNDIPVDIEVPLYSDEDEILVEVYPRVNLVDDINVEITVPYNEGMDEILVEIEANEYVRKVRTFVYII